MATEKSPQLVAVTKPRASGRRASEVPTQREAFIGLAHEERVKQWKGAPRAARIEHVNVRGRRLRLPIAAGRLRGDGDAGVSTTIYKAASQPT